MKAPLLTVFTPTYNRAHTLPRLFNSLKSQTCFDFEWLVIDDGSSDNTSVLFHKWLKDNHGFHIRYLEVENGGKNRAINIAIEQANGRYFMILDSDDMLTPDSVEFICQKMPEVENDATFIGISGKKADHISGRPVGVNDDSFSEDGYIDCSNLERGRFGLIHDMAEVFFTNKLKKYKFTVWKNEKFTPEEVVWNQIALDGYKLRWYNKITYLCEYQPGGLSDSTWRLLKDNPMGYAMMWNHRLLYSHNLKSRINAVMQYEACCVLANEWKELFKCRSKLLSVVLLPFSAILAVRRKRQINSLV